MTATGSPRSMFRRAIEVGNLVVAEVTIREMGVVTLEESLELVALVAMKDPRRHGRYAAQWVRRWLDAFPDATLDDVGFAVSALRELGGRRHGHALVALREMAEEASRRSTGRGQVRFKA